MTKLDATYAALSRRARNLSAFAWCGALLAAGGAAAAALTVAAEAAAWSFAGQPAAVAGIVLVAGLSGYVIGRSRTLNPSSVLLRADAGLATEARLSTLREIRDRDDLRPFAVRIAAGLPSRPLSPRVALPVARRHVALFLVGASLGILAFLTLIVFPPGRVAPAGDVWPPRADQTADSGRDAPTDERPGASDAEGRAAVPAQGPASDSAVPSEEVSWDLADLSQRAQRAGSLEEVLRKIEERLSVEEGVLTESEVAALETYMSSASAPLAEALRQLLSATAHESAVEKIRAVMGEPALATESQRLTREESGSTPRDELAASAMPADAADQAAPVSPVMAPEGATQPSGRSGAFPFFDDSTGGESSITLIGAPLPSSVGESGGYSYYITKSVPIEPAGDTPTTAGAPLSLSFEHASTIAAGRGLPNDALEAVRAYFTEITEGGL